MAEPATPLGNQAAIAQLHKAMNFLVTDLIRPNAQQIEATRAICESNARSIAAESDSIHELRESVEILRKVADDTADETTDLTPRVAENESRFDILLAEFRAERQKSDERFEAQLAEVRAQGEQIRALLSALVNTNGRVDDLEAAG